MWCASQDVCGYRLYGQQTLTGIDPGLKKYTNYNSGNGMSRANILVAFTQKCVQNKAKRIFQSMFNIWPTAILMLLSKLAGDLRTAGREPSSPKHSSVPLQALLFLRQ